MARRPYDPKQAIYIISVAAELAGVHPQTLRVYERKGLLNPQRTSGNTRRYSESDISLLRRIHELTQEGINLAGVERIMELERRVEQLQRRHARMIDELRRAEADLHEAMETSSHTAMIPFRDVRRIRRAMKTDAIEEAGRRRVFPSPPVDSI